MIPLVCLRVLVLLVVLAILPAGETASLIVQVVETGTVVDHAGDRSDRSQDPGDDDGGCSGMLNVCGCHGSPVTVPRVFAVEMILSSTRRDWVGQPAPGRGRVAATPPTRPPIA